MLISRTVEIYSEELRTKVAVDRWSLEHASKEHASTSKDSISTSFGSGIKGHESTCGHCHEDLRMQTATVSTEVGQDGRVVKRRKIAVGNFLCPSCPIGLHGRCAGLYGLSSGKGLNCPQHRCGICERSGSMAGGLLFRCVGCLKASCFDCAERLGVLDDVQFLTEGHGVWEDEFAYFPPGTYEYFKCPECLHAMNKTPQ